MIRKFALPLGVAALLVLAAVVVPGPDREAEAAVAPYSTCHNDTVQGSTSFYVNYYVNGDWRVLSDSDAAACTDAGLVKPKRETGAVFVCRAGEVVKLTGGYSGVYWVYPTLQPGDTEIKTLTQLAACDAP